VAAKTKTEEKKDDDWIVVPTAKKGGKPAEKPVAEKLVPEPKKTE
jgi:hypothetical protein